MARQPHFPLPLPKHWPRRVRSATVHTIALARLALTTARYPAGTTFAGAGLPPFEHEQEYYRIQEAPAMVAGVMSRTLRETRGGSVHGDLE